MSERHLFILNLLFKMHSVHICLNRKKAVKNKNLLKILLNNYFEMINTTTHKSKQV